MVLLLLLPAQVSGMLEMCKSFCNAGIGKSVSAFFKDFTAAKEELRKISGKWDGKHR
jgi:hypothetical protein